MRPLSSGDPIWVFRSLARKAGDRKMPERSGITPRDVKTRCTDILILCGCGPRSIPLPLSPDQRQHRQRRWDHHPGKMDR